MEDEQIIRLFFERKEDAIRAVSDTYGGYCRAIADRILPDGEDAEEVVADTWLQAWNTIPPARPQQLKLYLGKLTRNLALSRWRKNNAQRRGGGQVTLVLEELGENLSGGDTPEELWDTRELAEAISTFLRKLPEKQRQMFLLRYFYLEDIRFVAKYFGVGENSVRVILSRIRKKLREALLQEGFEL